MSKNPVIRNFFAPRSRKHSKRDSFLRQRMTLSRFWRPKRSRTRKLIRLLEKRHVHAENRLCAEDVKAFPFLSEVAEFLKRTREEMDLYQQIEAGNKKLGSLLSKY